MAPPCATLPDYVDSGLRVLSVGLNPSLVSVREGFYFANPRNRFWRAFDESGLAGSRGEPSRSRHQVLLEQDRIGFTDVVKRPSRQGHELRARDFRCDAPRLLQLIEEIQPTWAWFHGKQAYRYFLKYAIGLSPREIRWGLQSRMIGEARVYVTPNPSPANAAYSLADLRRRYRRLARHVNA
ncbi:MAG: mismatch-specific DNA-glycosylase [Gammaproteobacteria bacterium]|nr:mismatch-specific DNA-glycosylase [Gammaproteobacteria bacterium]